MAMNKRIQTTDLDFDGIKQNLKNYLQGQSQFSDYDFEGSGLSVLLDILALNTHYNALYTNLAVNESFLDSASKRSSVVSKAREIGYLPKSARSSTATVTVSMINNQIAAPATIELPAYTPFTTQVGSSQFTFYTTSAYTALKNGNLYLFPGVELKEGTFLRYQYTYSTGMQIIIPNTSVDTSTLTVTVQDNSQTTKTSVFVESSTILNLDNTSLIYFIKELDDQTYEMEFGDGVVGKALAPGNLITIEYFVCNQDAANGANTFTYAGTVPANTSIYTSTTSVASGGTAPESTESIRWNAPKAYSAQNRCVTAGDYVSTIMSMYPDAKSVSVWGGESSIPPQYGKVMVSIVPKTVDYLTEDQKTMILSDIIGPRKSLTVTPEIIDPIYLNIDVDVTFYYNPSHTTLTSADISALVRQSIDDYNNTNLNEFGGVFKYSKLSALIDSAENSITSNIMTIKLRRIIDPVYNVQNGYTINIGNPISNSGTPEESVRTTGLYTTESSEIVYFDDIPTPGTTIGNLRMFYINSVGAKVVLRNCGTVYYNTGIIVIDNLQITGLAGPEFAVTVKGQSNDVVSNQNQFIRIDPSKVTVNSVVDTPNKIYQFTSSRN